MNQEPEITNTAPEPDEGYMEYNESDLPLLLEPREAYDCCLMGFDNEDERAVYDAGAVIEKTMELHGIDDSEEALEFFDFNIAGSKGPRHPIYIWTDITGVLSAFSEGDNLQLDLFEAQNREEEIEDFDESFLDKKL